MSNPFDQFASEFQAALPPGAPGAAPPAADPSNPYAGAFADAPAPAPVPSNKPVMNAPVMSTPNYNGYGGGMGQPQGGMGQPQGGMGQPQGGMGQPQGQPQYGMGMPSGYGQPMGGPPPQYAPQMNGMTPPPPQGNDFGGYGAPPPTGPPAMPQSPSQNQPSQPAQPDQFTGYGAPAPPANDSFSGYGAPAPQVPPPQANDPFGGYGAPAPPQAPPQAPPAQNDPFGGYGVAPGPASQPPQNDPFASYGAPPAPAGSPAPWGQPGADPNMGALVPSNQPNQQYSQYAPQQPPQQQPPQQQPPQQQQQPATDPFSVFGSSPAPGPGAIVPVQAPQQQQAPPQHQAPPPANDDMWGEMGFDAPPSAGPPQAVAPSEHPDHSIPERHEHGESKDDGLPPGGEWYDARIFTPTLGVMFFKPQELTDSLFLNTERSVVDGLDERPVVAFIVEGSSARSAGVELGHVLLKVNGVDVRNPKEASRLIKEGPRPLPLLFYVPNTEVVVAEGEHMVKYDSRETTAPNSAKDWKPKYVVIGGIIAQPWMMNMYRSKSEYDIAVIETQARRPVSVKVKQFSLQGARVQNDWQGPQMVKYKNKLHPWKYIVVLPVARNPIKISSPNLAHLKPAHEGIRRVLLSQQRDRGGGGHTAAPVRRDPYSGGGGEQQGRVDPYSQQRVPQQQQQQQHHGQSQQAQRAGGYSGY